MISATGSLRSLRHRNYRLFYGANILSNIGSWAQRIAQDWLVLELTHSSKQIGIVTGLQFLPSLLFSMYGGKLADRKDKRKLLYITNGGVGITALILGMLVVNGSVQIWHVYILALLLGLFGAIDGPIRFAFTPELVGTKDIPNAVSLNSANFHMGRLIGPALSGFLIAWFGTGPSFLLNAGTYIFVLGALFMMNEEDLMKESKPKTEAKLREAIAYVRARKDIVAIMITVFFAGTFGLNFQIFSAMMATKIYGRGPATYGSLGSFIAIGSLTAAIISAKMDKRRGPRFVMGFATLFGIWVAVTSLMPTYIYYSATLPLLGFLSLTTMISANSYIQQTTDPQIRGRVMGIYLMVFMGGTPFGSPLVGWVMEHIGVRQTIAWCGIIASASAFITFMILRGNVARPASILVDDVLEADLDGYKG